MVAPQKYRQRYIAFKTENNLTKGDLKRIISNIGKELNLSPKPWLISYDRRTKQGLVKCGHRQVDKIKQKLSNKKIEFKIIGVSGTIKKTKQKFLSTSKLD